MDNINPNAFKLLLLDSDSDDDEYIIINLNRKKKRSKTHQSILNRDSEGIFTIYFKKYLLNDENRFKKYLRVSQEVFTMLLNAIKFDIEKEPCNRNLKPISPAHKLCLTLR